MDCFLQEPNIQSQSTFDVTVFTKEESNQNFTQQYVRVTVNDHFLLLGTTCITLLNCLSWEIEIPITKLVWFCHSCRLWVVFYRNQLSNINQLLKTKVFTKEQANHNFTQQYMRVTVREVDNIGIEKGEYENSTWKG